MKLDELPQIDMMGTKLYGDITTDPRNNKPFLLLFYRGSDEEFEIPLDDIDEFIHFIQNIREDYIFKKAKS